MNKEFRDWFVAERAKALAMVLMTRRDDLIVKETKDENGLDYTVSIKTEDKVGTRVFGVCMAAAMAPVTPEEANEQLQTVLAKARSLGPFHFPVCVFYFTVKDDQGYYAWAYEPVVTPEGEPKLLAGTTTQYRTLGDESLGEIISLVKRWYDSLYATITSSGTAEQAEGAVGRTLRRKKTGSGVN